MKRQRQRLRVAWDGPYPSVGQFVAGRNAGLLWLIVESSCDRLPPGEVMLTLARHDAPLPARAVLHPAERIQLCDVTGPARTRQIAGAGPIAVMRSSWRDPEDNKPNASRRPRQITGYRTFCALRRMANGAGSQITDAHIAAADAMRAQVDLALIGRGGATLGDLAPQGFGPSAGPSAAALEQAFADHAVRKVLRRLAPEHCRLLSHVVLLNHSIASWCKLLGEARDQSQLAQREMGRLLTILDILADHYETEVKTTLLEAIE